MCKFSYGVIFFGFQKEKENLLCLYYEVKSQWTRYQCLLFCLQSSSRIGTPLPAQMYFLKLYLDLIEGIKAYETLIL